ncbi:hypothetical protein [Streptomyces sp. NPDC007100]|uniref:hypothetical protein n=1 Tax=Streptomyces sp. NPDC007100 TaxID=3155602 RepID=UPI0033E008EA
MSDVSISYTTQVSPETVTVTVTLGLAGTHVRLSVTDLSSFTVILTPQGDLEEKILSGIAWPVAQSLALLLPPLAHKLIAGRAFDVLAVPDVPPQHVGDKLVNPVLEQPTLTSRDGSLIFSATPKLVTS